jgi:hypothetical protein
MKKIALFMILFFPTRQKYFLNYSFIRHKIDNLGALHTTAANLSVEKTKDPNNLVGGEQKFVHWAFTLKANGQKTIAFRTPT